MRFWHIIFLLIYDPHVAMLDCSSKTLPGFIKGEGRIGVAGTKLLHSQYVIDQSAVQALIFSCFSFQQNSLFPIKVKHKRMCCSEFCQLFSLPTSNSNVIQCAAIPYAVPELYFLIPVSFQTPV